MFKYGHVSIEREIEFTSQLGSLTGIKILIVWGQRLNKYASEFNVTVVKRYHCIPNDKGLKVIHLCLRF